MARRAKVTKLSGWRTEKEGYSPENVYRGSTDGRGHNVGMRVNVPPNVSRQVNEIAHSPEHPAYSTPQDVVRDAIIHRLHYLNELKPTEGMTQMLLVEELERMHDEREEARLAVKRLVQLLEEEREDEDALRGMIAAIKKRLPMLRKKERGEVQEVLERFDPGPPT